jgi:hypothetical protein
MTTAEVARECLHMFATAIHEAAAESLLTP